MRLKRKLYYGIKPFVPWNIRIMIRRYFARKKLKQNKNCWPINESVAIKPENWPGWPEGKQFAFVLSHDVEGKEGLEKVRQLAELEMEEGYRSSFNFIPEGDYKVPKELISWLTENGFEIGVHDLHHDGKLYQSRGSFLQNAKKINSYLKAWGAVGFRSGFMLRNLEWINHLDILYDASTFDTDPFEPQPDGVNTIFPYLIKCAGGENGYIELPYTLAQDSTLFLLFKESTNQIWKKKLDWIASKGGMALLNVHPDYLSFNSACKSNEFDSQIYRDFLQYAKREYGSLAWESLPKQVAEYAKSNLNWIESRDPVVEQKKIWIDLENTPHIPFFNPIVRELRKEGYLVVLSARDAYQTCEMADMYGFDYVKIGHHYGKSKFWKFYGLFARALELLPFVLKEKPDLSLNHGSRTQNLISKIMGITTVSMMDYEHSKGISFLNPRWEMAPDVMPQEVTSSHSSQKDEGVLNYTGIKEDVYVPDFIPDPSIIDELGLSDAEIITTVRPPATEAHYHNPEAEALFEAFLNRIMKVDGAVAVILPRNKRQENTIRTDHPEWFENDKAIIPKDVIDGLNLMWHSDLVVSGGGTMNREAAALNIPVYSIFRGTIGSVDKHLANTNRLVLIENLSDIQNRIALKKRTKFEHNKDTRPALRDIINHIKSILNAN